MTNIEKLTRFMGTLKHPDEVMTAFTAAAETIAERQENKPLKPSEQYPNIAKLVRKALEHKKMHELEQLLITAAEAEKGTREAP